MLAIAIPCHRIISAQGDMTGYRWGIERKRALLAWENTIINHSA
jgi:AraC family transcriptional regulator of adaptative response/methylated-DNA-[protein]-cysteine methyltransferase